MSNPKKICCVTGTRADYGLLRNLMGTIKRSDTLKLQTLVTGMHLSEKFGYTIKEIENDGFAIDERFDMELFSDSPTGIAHSSAVGLEKFTEAFERLTPDLVLVLGDRYEVLSAAIAAGFSRIPVAHLHGGESTEGLIDEAIRHSVTKFSHLHFVATEEYRRRVIQLGENPSTVFNVGGLGVDAISKLKLIDRSGLEADLGFQFAKYNLLVTFHPVTLEENTAGLQMAALLKVLSELKDTQLIFTMPNADADGHILFELIEKFVRDHRNSCAFKSLGQLRYLSCMAQVDVVIGNSSSGIAEAPSFKKATVNIGDRQKGRMQACSVVNCAPDEGSIRAAIATAYSPGFRAGLQDVKNPYGDGGATDRILAILERTQLSDLLKKSFFDLDIK